VGKADANPSVKQKNSRLSGGKRWLALSLTLGGKEGTRRGPGKTRKKPCRTARRNPPFHFDATERKGISEGRKKRRDLTIRSRLREKEESVDPCA